MSDPFPTKLRAILSERVLPGAASFAGGLFGRLASRLEPTIGVVIVPTREVGWSPFAIDLPAPREKMLLSEVQAAIEAEHASGEAKLSLGTIPPGFIVSKVLRDRNEAFNVSDTAIWFTSPAVHHLGFDLIAMLGISHQVLDELPHVRVQAKNEVLGVVGLAEATAQVFLRCVAGELGTMEALFREFRPREDMDDILRDAGEEVVYRVMNTLYTNPLMAFGRNVFEHINQVASLQYENVEGRGVLVFAQPKDESLAPSIRFAKHVPLPDAVWARKMIELSTRSLAVVGNDREMFGLVRLDSCGDHFCAEFVNGKTWRLRYGGDRVLMEVIRGVPRLPRSALSREEFASALGRIFPSSSPNVEALWLLTERAQRASHGTMLVISIDAAGESKRLDSQGTPITPTALDESAVESATRIDGSVLVDPNGLCHAIGVILDGDATSMGTPARGARFNSAVRYATSPDRPRSLAVVVSEDGHVNLLPRLRPQIARRELQELLELAGQDLKGDTVPDEVTSACYRLAYYYSEYVEDPAVFRRAVDIAVTARFLGSRELWEREISGTYDRHASDIIEGDPP